MVEKKIDLAGGWLDSLEQEFAQPYMQSLKAFLVQQKSVGKTVYPPGSQIFNALNSAPLDKVKVVILGQDPYHGPGQAHGLSFSVPEGVLQPPSLQNILKEISSDLGLPVPDHGCLQAWADQGVLLLNAVLTVEQRQAGSHAGKGWEQFTDRIVAVLNEQREHLVFMLWGAYAQKKGQLIDTSRHLVLKAPHPSPLSAHRGFFGCKHFSQANAYLEQHGIAPVDWSLSRHG